MPITRKSLADTIEEYDTQIADLQAGKRDTYQAYRDEIGALMGKDAVKIEIEAFKVALKRRNAIAKKGEQTVEEKDALADEIFAEISGSNARRATRVENASEFPPAAVDREARAKNRLSEAMDDNKALSAQMLADGLISEEAHAENIAISDGVARKLGAGVIETNSTNTPRGEPGTARKASGGQPLPGDGDIGGLQQGAQPAPRINSGVPTDGASPAPGGASVTGSSDANNPGVAAAHINSHAKASTGNAVTVAAKGSDTDGSGDASRLSDGSGTVASYSANPGGPTAGQGSDALPADKSTAALTEVRDNTTEASAAPQGLDPVAGTTPPAAIAPPVEPILFKPYAGPRDSKGLPRPVGCMSLDACGSSTWRHICHTCSRALTIEPGGVEIEHHGSVA